MEKCGKKGRSASAGAFGCVSRVDGKILPPCCRGGGVFCACARIVWFFHFVVDATRSARGVVARLPLPEIGLATPMVSTGKGLGTGKGSRSGNGVEGGKEGKM